ncbi:SSH3 (predicted) [Pycnogonum litorale]
MMTHSERPFFASRSADSQPLIRRSASPNQIGLLGRHSSTSRISFTRDDSATTKRLASTVTDVKVQLGTRWDADKVSLDGGLVKSMKDSIKQRRSMSGGSSYLSVQDIGLRFVESNPKSENKINKEDKDQILKSRKDSQKLRDIVLQTPQVNTCKLRPRSPTTMSEYNRNSYETFPDKTISGKRSTNSYRTSEGYDKVDSPTMKNFPGQVFRKDILVALYRGNAIVEVIENLFLGSIESVFNEQLLCRLNVHCIVDLSNVRTCYIPNASKSICPCSCSQQMRHSRAKLYIDISNDETAEMAPYYDEINRFVEAARLSARGVLIHSYHGRSRAPTSVIQYMMKCQGVTLNQAYETVKQRWTKVNINRRFMKELIELDGSLYPEQENCFRTRLNPFVTTETAVNDETRNHRKCLKAWS